MTRLKPFKNYRIGSWNVLSLTDTSGKQSLCMQSLKKAGMDIVAVQEVRIPGEGARAFGEGYTMEWYGEGFGMGMIVKDNIMKAKTSSRQISPRIMTMTFNCYPQELYIVNVHSPTQATAPSDAHEVFWRDVRTALSCRPRNAMVVLLGDMNAQLVASGAGSDSARRRAIGAYAYKSTGPQQSNADELTQLLLDFNLVATNTWFCRRRRQLVTHNNNSGYQAQLDYICVSRKLLPAVRNVTTLPGTAMWSDHSLVRMDIKIAAKFKWNPSPQRPAVHLPSIRTDPVAYREYQTAVRDKLAMLAARAGTLEDIDDKWNLLSTAIGEALPQFYRMRFKRQKWISDETLDEVERFKRLRLTNASDETLKQEKRQLRTLLKRDKTEHAERAVQTVEEAARKHDLKSIYKYVNMFGKGHQTCASLPELESHFRAVWSQQQAAPPPVPPTSWTRLPCPSAEELQKTLTTLRRNKMTGHDGIPAEALQLLPAEGIAALLDMARCFWNDVSIPATSEPALIVAIAKKQPSNNPINNRPIAVQTTVLKFLEACVLHELRPRLIPTLLPNQAAYLPGRGTTDNVSAVRVTLETRAEFNLPSVVVSYDLAAAFDSVDRRWAFHALRGKEIPEHLIQLCECLYSKCSGQLILRGAASDTFPLRSGLRQGSLLSPLLFISLLDCVLRKCMGRMQVEFPEFSSDIYSNHFLQYYAYADDILFLCSSVQTAEFFTRTLADELGVVGLSINPNKCLMLSTNPQDLHSSPFTIPTKSHLIYLGATIALVGTSGLELSLRKQRAQAALARIGKNTLYNGKLPLSLRSRIYAATVRAILVYSLGTCVLVAKDMKSLDVFERSAFRRMCHGWRPILREGRQLWVPIANPELYSRLHLGPVSLMVQKLRYTWLCHVARRDDSHITKTAVANAINGTPQSKRTRGGQKLTWLRLLSRESKDSLPGCTGLQYLWNWASTVTKQRLSIFLI